MSSEPVQMDQFGLFKMYHAVFLHYTSDYDYFKYQGKTSYKKETFEKRKDKYTFTKMKRIFEYSDYDYMEYYISWLFFDKDKWVTPQIVNTEMLKFDMEWKEYGMNRLENFRRDWVKITTWKARAIFDLILQNELHWCTLLVLDSLKQISFHMNAKLKGDFLWDERYKKFTKFKSFYLKHEPIHEMSFRQIILENPK